MHDADKIYPLQNQTDEALEALFASLKVGLTPSEGRSIESDMLKRPPSLTELLLWSVQGSEHCSYKSTRSHLSSFVTDGPNVMLGPVEDAGIVSIATDNRGKKYGLVMSHESHNHPSQIVPFEGAATGIGGNVRDVCCMGARVVAVADGLRFGSLDDDRTREIYEGVVLGIAGYGNPIGVPNISTDISFHDSYKKNCLVNVVTLGTVREDKIIHSYAPKNAAGHDLILVGKATDMSGFGGASFASSTLEETKRQQNKGAVQEPNAFLKRHLLVAHYALFDKLHKLNEIANVGLKDLGAGGIACASVELADHSGYGATVQLDDVPTSIEGLHPSVTLLSETQERFMWVSPPRLTKMILDHFNKTFELGSIAVNARATVVGKITKEKQYTVYSKGKKIVDAKASDVTSGIRYHRPYHAPTSSPLPRKTQKTPPPFHELMLSVLKDHNVCDTTAVTEHYDGQVQGHTLLDSKQSRTGVLAPLLDSSYPQEVRSVGVALSLFQNPSICSLNPYWGAINATSVAMCKVAAVGASPWALTDCLNFGNPEIPEQMWEFVEAVRGICDTQHGYHLREYPSSPIPIISGNVSLYNSTPHDKIVPSPLIGCLGKLSNIGKVISQQAKKPDSSIILLGRRTRSLGGSVYETYAGTSGTDIPKVPPHEVEKMIYALLGANDSGLIQACGYIAQGGAAATITILTLDTPLGINIEKGGSTEWLFDESPGFICIVDEAKRAAIEMRCMEAGSPAEIIGSTSGIPRFGNGKDIDIPMNALHHAYKQGLPTI